MKKVTESSSNYDYLENMSTLELLRNINQEDKTIADKVAKEIPKIIKLVDKITSKIQNKGRLFYIGAGTSGRLGILDASECPPTFGVDYNLVIGLIAGGDKAIRKAVEFAEDTRLLGWEDLQSYNINDKDYNNRLNELVDMLDIKDKLNIQVRRLSLGERMKMEIIASLLHNPGIVFLDEPTLGLDVISQSKIREFVQHYNKEYKTTFLLTSHYMHDIEALCKRVFVIHKGISLYGSYDDVQ